MVDFYERILALSPKKRRFLSIQLGKQQGTTPARNDVPESKRLIAYIVPHREQSPTIDELRHFLHDDLPDHMIPSVFMVLEKLPLTPSGKVDRRALPDPDITGTETLETFAAARTSTEKALAGIWAEVLEIKQVGMNDNFFELGGHSLLAMQIVSRVSTAMDLDIPVKFLFSHPTIATLAVELGELLQKRESVKSLPLKTTENPGLTEPLEENLRQHVSSLFKLEDHSLESAAPFDAIALDYFLTSALEQTGMSRDEIIHEWGNNFPVLYNVTETSWGRIGTLMLPLFDSDLYSNKEALMRNIADGLNISQQLGARVVSLTGLLPSATNYGRDVAKMIDGQEDLPVISTGHATTCATVVLTIRKILQEGGRELTQERVGFVGLGSIGMSTLRLMLQCLPHPMDIILCDVYKKLDFLEKIRRELLNDLGFDGKVHIIPAQTEVPPEIYNATLIIGATNVPDILDVTKLQPGTMLVDDSGPHCFRPELAIRRFQEQQDILFTEGGVLRSPRPITDRIYLPFDMKKDVEPAQIMHWFSLKGSPFDVTSCVFSGLLSCRFEGLLPTVGEVDAKAAFEHYEVLDLLGFRGADLHCEDYALSEELIRNFRNSFGKS